MAQTTAQRQAAYRKRLLQRTRDAEAETAYIREQAWAYRRDRDHEVALLQDQLSALQGQMGPRSLQAECAQCGRRGRCDGTRWLPDPGDTGD